MIRVAVIGSGPSGFYAAAQLLDCDEPVFAVDLFDRLPTPFGLVRAGVAPDHPKIKSVTRAFDKVARHDRFRFFGHVEIGTDVSRAELLERYHAVVYAIGTATDRRLGISGEELRGSHPATELVAWYNGHPDFCDLEVDLAARHVVVVGAGNVALDVARMLALAPSELAVTDTADHAIEAMTGSGIEEITVLARRGPLQAAFTNPELLEMGELERADVTVDGAALDPLSQRALADADRTRRRNVEILQEYAARPPAGKPVTIRFRFLTSPVELLGDADGHVRALRVEANELVEREDGSLGVRGTGRFDELDTSLVFRAVGYTGVRLGDVPFDERRGVIPNRDGRVTGEDGAVLPGEYVTGWIKRGPSGVIGTNKKDSLATVTGLIADARAGALPEPTAGDIADVLAGHVDWTGWQAIDRVETEAGLPQGRPRVKLSQWEELREAGGLHHTTTTSEDR